MVIISHTLLAQRMETFKIGSAILPVACTYMYMENQKKIDSRGKLDRDAFRLKCFAHPNLLEVFIPSVGNHFRAFLKTLL